MNGIKEKFKSVRVRLFLSLCIVVSIIVIFLIIINNVVLESFYLYSKIKNVRLAYEKINSYYSEIQNDSNYNIDIDKELENISIKNDFDILIVSDQNVLVFSSEKNLTSSVNKINEVILNRKNNQFFSEGNIDKRNRVIYKNDNVTIRRIVDEKNSMNYIFLSATLDNGNTLYIRIQVASIQESVKISNNLLVLIGGVSILIAGVLASFISKKFTEPILELNGIAQNMSKLDFSKKYRVKDTDDEINNLGKSINTMSDKLEATIKQLRNTNVELEKDIEEKSKIDEMRKQFISDVSHELKTPIALIQGYAEGLIENVNDDEESRKFYAEVILDESNKMDTLVKQLLELMKLEYGKREFNNVEFNIGELIKEVIRKCDVMLKEKQIEVEYDDTKEVYVNADEFYIEQVITNYLTNAIKNAKTINEKKKIQVKVEETKNQKVRITVFNTGDKIKDEDLERIWKRFYKSDSSRNREDGGTGIGLSLVKAIMNNYKNDYGVNNKENGVEFYFELDKKQ